PTIRGLDLMSRRRACAVGKCRIPALIAVAFTALVLASPSLIADAGEGTNQVLEPAQLTLANRHILIMRSAGVAASPSIRARAVQENLVSLARRGGALEVTTRPMPEGVGVLVDGSLVFRVLQEDAHPELGEDVQQVADAAVVNLRIALAEMHELRDPRQRLR